MALLAADLTRAPDRQFAVGGLRAGIHLYQRTLSALLPRVGIQCRFTPTCSRYADAVIARHGAVTGTWLTVKRLAKCGPWTAAGTVDPPP